MKKIIFTQRVHLCEQYNERWDCADQKIAQLLRTCGYMPIPVPNQEKLVEDFSAMVFPSGILLTGGNSLMKYGGNAPERDGTDVACISVAVKHGIPVIGFCRGMQSLLDYFGERLEEVKNHVGVRHQVRGKICREVNSYHSLGCLSLDTGAFEVLAQAEDGCIEAVRHKEYPFLGIMWHPEREENFRAEDISMVKELFGREE